MDIKTFNLAMDRLLGNYDLEEGLTSDAKHHIMAIHLQLTEIADNDRLRKIPIMGLRSTTFLSKHKALMVKSARLFYVCIKTYTSLKVRLSAVGEESHVLMFEVFMHKLNKNIALAAAEFKRSKAYVRCKSSNAKRSAFMRWKTIYIGKITEDFNHMWFLGGQQNEKAAHYYNRLAQKLSQAIAENRAPTLLTDVESIEEFETRMYNKKDFIELVDQLKPME